MLCPSHSSRLLLLGHFGTAYLAHPDFYQLREWETKIVTEGVSQGRTKVKTGGRKIIAMDRVDPEKFYHYILQQWAR